TPPARHRLSIRAPVTDGPFEEVLQDGREGAVADATRRPGSEAKELAQRRHAARAREPAEAEDVLDRRQQRTMVHSSTVDGAATHGAAQRDQRDRTAAPPPRAALVGDDEQRTPRPERSKQPRER